VLDCPDILISLAPSYTRAILEGKKTVELRRRRIHVVNGTRVWLYSKVPAARIEGTALVRCVVEGDPKGLWSKYSESVGISKADFDRYFLGCANGCAIILCSAHAIDPGLDLSTLRSKVPGFHPPQFFKRLDAEEMSVLLQTSSARPLNGSAHPQRKSRPHKKSAIEPIQIQRPSSFEGICCGA
jgi:predicted transcriptional regulator